MKSITSISHLQCGAQPFYTTLGTKGRRPDGCHMPLCAAGAGPFGNTGKHHPLNPFVHTKKPDDFSSGFFVAYFI